MLPTSGVHAADITQRSLTLQSGDDGGSTAGGNVAHHFAFTVPTTDNIGSIEFEYCTTASGTCTLPTGLDTTSATLDFEDTSGTNGGATGFSIVNTANGAPHITRTAAEIATTTELGYTLGNVTNPTTVNETFFVRISTFTTEDATGEPVDTGTVTASTAEEIVLSGTMPESLIFCTGETVDSTSGIPDCSTATSGAVEFNQLFSPTDTAFATSQMAASTNADNGYSITINGDTLTSGTNTIPAMSSADVSTQGTGQFGLNLKENTDPVVGSEVTPAADGTDLRGQAATDYDTVDTFKFADGDAVANSYNGGAGPTNAQIFTSSYIVNVPGNQPAGSYTTTLTYVCTATF